MGERVLQLLNLSVFVEVIFLDFSIFVLCLVSCLALVQGGKVVEG